MHKKYKNISSLQLLRIYPMHYHLATAFFVQKSIQGTCTLSAYSQLIFTSMAIRKSDCDMGQLLIISSMEGRGLPALLMTTSGLTLLCGMVQFFLWGGVHPIFFSFYIFRLQSMKNNQKVLELHPHLSKLIDSLCFELAVNVPDQNSLSLLEIIVMKRNGDISNEELKELYTGWLESKNVFDLFTAKQVKIYSKCELVGNKDVSDHLHISSINGSLEILHDLYDDFLRARKKQEQVGRRIKETEDLFSYLDCEGNIHLRLSQLFFLHLAAQIYDNQPIPNNYEAFKPIFKAKNKELCEVQGMVSLRWFKNYFIVNTQNTDISRHLLSMLKDMEKAIRENQRRGNKSFGNSLPNILDEAFLRWRTSSRFSGLFESKKKKLQIYHRIFDENQEIFFFNGGKDDTTLSEAYFIKKYGDQYIKSLQIDTLLLKQFETIVKEILNEYLAIVSRIFGTTPRHNKSSTQHVSANRSSKMHESIQYPSQSVNNSAIYSQKLNQSYQYIKTSNTRSRDKTPIKNGKGNETRRFNVTPTNKTVSPFIHRQFGSTQRSLSKHKNEQTPTKSTINPSPHLTGTTNHQQQVYRNSKKQGLQKDSFYEKLFFFRNKRVQSFDIVIKRLKGK